MVKEVFVDHGRYISVFKKHVDGVALKELYGKTGDELINIVKRLYSLRTISMITVYDKSMTMQKGYVDSEGDVLDIQLHPIDLGKMLLYQEVFNRMQLRKDVEKYFTQRQPYFIFTSIPYEVHKENNTKSYISEEYATEVHGIDKGNKTFIITEMKGTIDNLFTLLCLVAKEYNVLITSIPERYNEAVVLYAMGFYLKGQNLYLYK